MIGDLGVVFVLEEEMLVAGDADLGQMNDGVVAAVGVDRFGKLISHLQDAAPIIARGHFDRLVGDVITEIEHDRLIDKFGENFLGNGEIFDRRVTGWDRLRHFSLGEGEAAAGLDRHHGSDLVGRDRDVPAGAPALRMGNKDAVAASPENLHKRVGDNLLIKVSRIGRHLAEELIERLFVVRELAVLVSVRPQADTKLGVPGLILRERRDFAGLAGLPGFAAAGMIHQIDAAALAQERIASAFAPVGSRLPAHAGLSVAVQEYHRTGAARGGDLKEHVGVVGMVRLTFRLELTVNGGRRRRAF